MEAKPQQFIVQVVQQFNEIRSLQLVRALPCLVFTEEHGNVRVANSGSASYFNEFAKAHYSFIAAPDDYPVSSMKASLSLN